MTTSLDDLNNVLDLVEDPMIDLRRDLHAHPELSNEEHRTTGIIKDRLTSLGFDLRPCPTATGVVAKLRGSHPGKHVMLRADIDALPVTEERDLAYASRSDGVMHACGHDVHTAALLGIADLLARRQEQIAGEYTLLFQPAEEVVGGATAMIEGGVLDERPDYLIGAHVTSMAPVGLVATRAGILMSEIRSFDVTISGKGGHGAMASLEGNVVLALSHLTPRLSEVVEGMTYEGTSCVCSAGVIGAGTKNNVVPRHAHLSATLRTFTPQQQGEALERLDQLLSELETTFGVRTVLEVSATTPPVTNDPGVVERVMASATTVVGSGGVAIIPPVTPSDDVSEFLLRVPGCYLLIGGALPDGSSGMHHGGDFAIDDSACRVIAGVLARSALDLAGQS